MPLVTRVAKGFKIAYPVALEETYGRQLQHFSTKLQQLALEKLNSDEFKSSLNKAVRQDDLLDDFDKIIKYLHVAISVETKKMISGLSGRFTFVKKFVDRSFNRSIMHMLNHAGISGAAFSKLAPAVPAITDINLLKRMWIQTNTRLIKSIPADSLSKVSDAVFNAVRSGESVQSLANKINNIFETTKKRARLIARDQIGKLKSDLSRHNDLSHGITSYEWSSCKDGAVRASHAALEGKICSWIDSRLYKNKINDKKWKKRSSIAAVEKHAGEDIMCRCTNIIVCANVGN